MNTMVYIYAILIVSAIVFFLVVLNLYKFQPTKYWFAKHFRLFRFFEKVDNIDEIPIREIE